VGDRAPATRCVLSVYDTCSAVVMSRWSGFGPPATLSYVRGVRGFLPRHGVPPEIVLFFYRSIVWGFIRATLEIVRVRGRAEVDAVGDAGIKASGAGMAGRLGVFE
jgi:hypothetical protein